MNRRHMEEKHKDKGDRWLLTYSDLITLLLALFIIMYAMSSDNAAKLQDMSAALTEAFNGGTEKSAPYAAPGPLEHIYEQLKGYVDEAGISSQVDMVKSDHSISIRLRDSLLFKGNSATLNEGSIDTLTKVGDIISQVYQDINHITITGNTADLGNRDPANEADSWQLSVDRAVKILNVLTSKGLGPEKLSIEGNSHYNPVASNDSPQGRAANRRVDITINDGYH